MRASNITKSFNLTRERASSEEPITDVRSVAWGLTGFWWWKKNQTSFKLKHKSQTYLRSSKQFLLSWLYSSSPPSDNLLATARFILRVSIHPFGIAFTCITETLNVQRIKSRDLRYKFGVFTPPDNFVMWWSVCLRLSEVGIDHHQELCWPSRHGSSIRRKSLAGA